MEHIITALSIFNFILEVVMLILFICLAVQVIIYAVKQKRQKGEN